MNPDVWCIFRWCREILGSFFFRNQRTIQESAAWKDSGTSWFLEFCYPTFPKHEAFFPKGKAQQFAPRCWELGWEAKHCTPTFGSKRMALRSSWRRRKRGTRTSREKVWKMVFHGHPPHGKQKASQQIYVPRNPLKPETLRRFPKKEVPNEWVNFIIRILLFNYTMRCWKKTTILLYCHMVISARFVNYSGKSITNKLSKMAKKKILPHPMLSHPPTAPGCWLIRAAAWPQFLGVEFFNRRYATPPFEKWTVEEPQKNEGGLDFGWFRWICTDLQFLGWFLR